MWSSGRNPYPVDYRPAFAFSRFLYPQSLQLPSRVAFPFRVESLRQEGENYGLTAFRKFDRIGLGALFPPAVLDAHDRGLTNLDNPLRCRFGSGLAASWAGSL